MLRTVHTRNAGHLLPSCFFSDYLCNYKFVVSALQKEHTPAALCLDYVLLCDVGEVAALTRRTALSSFFSGLYISFSTTSPYTFSLCSLGLRQQASHPYKVRDKIIFNIF